MFYNLANHFSNIKWSDKQISEFSSDDNSSIPMSKTSSYKFKRKDSDYDSDFEDDKTNNGAQK